MLSKSQKGGRLFSIRFDSEENRVESLKRFDPPEKQNDGGNPEGIEVGEAKERIEAALQQEIITWLPERQARAGLQISLVGLHFE